MTKVNCTYQGCREQGSHTGKTRDNWEFHLCKDHATKLRPMIEQTGPYKAKVKLEPPILREKNGSS